MTDINVGAITEALNDKTDRDLQNADNTAGADAVIEFQVPTAENNYTWYRKYKSGWVEQGGTRSYSNAEEVKTITLPITMADSNYTLQLTRKDGSAAESDTSYNRQQYYSKTTTGFSFMWSMNNRQSAIDWLISGMAAQ